MKQNQQLSNKITKLEEEKSSNIFSDKINSMLGSIPQTENAEKILKYERSLQKSIYENLIMLKKLQGNF